jgi:hypothetical protein
MRTLKFIVIAMLLWAMPLQAKILTVVLNDAVVLQGNLLGVTEEKLVLAVEQKARNILRSQIKEIFDTESKAKLEYEQLLKTGAATSAQPDRTMGQDQPAPVKPPAFPQAGKKEQHFVMYVQGTLMNSYNRGKLDQWFAERTGIPNNAVDAGATTFFKAGLELDFELDAGVEIGTGLDMIFPASHSLWGSYLFYGGRQEVVLDPQIISVNMPVRFSLGDETGLWLKLVPSMLMGWVSGYYTSPWYDLEFTPSPGFGFGIAGGLDLMFGENFGVNVDMGLRILEVDLAYVDENSATGFSQPLLSDGELVTVDLGGLYMVAGFMFRF